ncbi:MAG: hypothetical protein JO163_04950 [Methylobacteriaceae bacterium]|nr:hypothetical protein [Methylobacteriaceae bacterium]MBV9634631.1 hypothetical protein [Methylobacteriaceae bacterium]MBV9702055.1 hypothetical protein [Methylobacteriaceae bacterium]
MIAERWRIGIDFDNTIIGYDAAFLAAAKDRGLLDRDFSGTKQAIRDAVRCSPDGEVAWQQLQGFVYGAGIDRAVVIAGVDAFLDCCKAAGHVVYIVSHKTEFGHFDPLRVNLRTAALNFMRRHGFFDATGHGIPVDQVHFEATRAAKLARIAALGCTHFIDDLEEVLGDPDFPAGVERILLGEATGGQNLPYAAFPTWQAIEHALLDASIRPTVQARFEAGCGPGASD